MLKKKTFFSESTVIEDALCVDSPEESIKDEDDKVGDVMQLTQEVSKDENDDVICVRVHANKVQFLRRIPQSEDSGSKESTASTNIKIVANDAINSCCSEISNPTIAKIIATLNGKSILEQFGF